MKFLKLSILLAYIVGYISANSNQKYYEFIGIKPQSSVEACKKQCRMLLKKHKPENYPGDGDNHEKYVKIKDICQDLTHPDKKMVYDQQGDEGLKQLKQQQGGRGGWGRQQTGPSMAADIPVTLQDLYVGADKEFSFQKNVICDHCRGTGDKSGQLKVCPHCKGKGHVMQNVQMGVGFTMQMQQPCNRCGGKGKTGHNNCPVCKGKKVKKSQETKSIQVKPGMKNGQEITFKGEAEQSPDYAPGDLIFTLKQKEHGYFKRVEDTLYLKIDLKLKDSIMGFQKKVRHLDDHYVMLESKKGNVVQPFENQVIKGEGMPKEGYNKKSQKGDMSVRYNVQLPKKLTEEDRDILKKIFSIGKQQQS